MLNAYVKETITKTILDALEAGNVGEWVKPWRTIGRPRSLAYQRPYSGVNLWTLSAVTLAAGLAIGAAAWAPVLYMLWRLTGP